MDFTPYDPQPEREEPEPSPEPTYTPGPAPGPPPPSTLIVGQSGGGMVSVTMNGRHEVRRVSISNGDRVTAAIETTTPAAQKSRKSGGVVIPIHTGR